MRLNLATLQLMLVMAMVGHVLSITLSATYSTAQKTSSARTIIVLRTMTFQPLPSAPVNRGGYLNSAYFSMLG